MFGNGQWVPSPNTFNALDGLQVHHGNEHIVPSELIGALSMEAMNFLQYDGSLTSDGPTFSKEIWLGAGAQSGQPIPVRVAMLFIDQINFRKSDPFIPF